MDPSRFDDLTRRLGAPRTRRGLLGSLAGLAAGVAGLRAAEAACPAGQVPASGGRCICKSTGRPPGPSGCSAGPGQTLCNGVAVDLTSDANNCGSCGAVCPIPSGGSTLCRASQCYGVCPAGTTLCGTCCGDPTGDTCQDFSCCLLDGRTCNGNDEACCSGRCSPLGLCCVNDRAERPCGSPDPCGGRCQTGICGGTCTECVGGRCQPKTCPPLPCKKPGVCNPATNACEYEDLADGSTCDAGTVNRCTEGATCQGGECVEGADVVTPTCSQGDCYSETCNPSTGWCVRTAKACDASCDGNRSTESCGDPLGTCLAEGMCTEDAHGDLYCFKFEDGFPVQCHDQCDVCDEASGQCTPDAGRLCRQEDGSYGVCDSSGECGSLGPSGPPDVCGGCPHGTECNEAPRYCRPLCERRPCSFPFICCVHAIYEQTVCCLSPCDVCLDAQLP